MRARSVDEGVLILLEDFELDLLRQLPQGLRTLLDDPDPDDPAVQRLFPACVEDDDEADAELRRMIFDDLLRDRLEGLDALSGVLERAERHRGRNRVILTEDEPALMLGVLNDVRLTLGARAGIERLDRSEITADHPVAPTVAVMDHLGWLQEQLLEVLDPSAVQGLD